MLQNPAGNDGVYFLRQLLLPQHAYNRKKGGRSLRTYGKDIAMTSVYGRSGGKPDNLIIVKTRGMLGIVEDCQIIGLTLFPQNRYSLNGACGTHRSDAGRQSRHR
jgi:hypothetical protein